MMKKSYHKIIVATGNKGKLNEFTQILRDFEFFSARDFGLSTEFEETGVTFKENAVIKVKTIGIIPDAVIVADDSGLVIDALNGEPGIYSARYMGVDTPYDIKNAALLNRMQNIKEEQRGARFICAIAALFPNGEIHTAEGIMEGKIAYAPAGENGFGYDPIFYLPEMGLTSSQLSPDEKNAISHRGKAIEGLRQILQNYG